jgi:hypothetical protein
MSMLKNLSHILNKSGLIGASGAFLSAEKGADLDKKFNSLLATSAKDIGEFEPERVIDFITGLAITSPLVFFRPVTFLANATLGWPKTFLDVDVAIENHIIRDAKRLKSLFDRMDKESRKDLLRINPDIATPLLQRRDRRLMEAVWHFTHSCGDPADDPLKATATIGDCLKAIIQTEAEYVEPESPEELRRSKINEFIALRWFRIGPTMEGR